MTEWISKKIILQLIKEGVIYRDVDVYLYGCNAIIYTIISTLGLLVISSLCHHFSEGCICIVCFYLNQSVGGGFHADTHWKCFSVMTIGLLLCFGMMELVKEYYVLLFAGLLSFLVLFIKPLVLNPYLDYLKNSSDTLIHRSKTITCLEAGIYICIAFMGFKHILSVLSAAITLCALSRIAGFIAFGKGAV